MRHSFTCGAPAVSQVPAMLTSVFSLVGLEVLVCIFAVLFLYHSYSIILS